MSILKCKMCGGTVEFENGATVGICDSCGTKQTLPRLDDDRKANLYDRANHFRRNNEYDKAMSIYEQILNEDSTDAESYWSIVLCKYGIEYVEDPATHKRVPTVNRAQFTSVVADDDYKKAIEYADIEQKIIYEEEARAIDEIQKGILEISQKEEPFDVFICYKETDNNGRRTQDSVLANDLYHQLTQEGFKVFFSRITLEDKLGTAYEPYIFAALNSSKVMVVIGTKPEYFNAVWVKNEWSRYLALIKKGEKKMLIPAYRDMDPYDLPEEFSHLQAQDMTKLGFMQDLIRGIKKIIGENQKNVQNVTTVVAGGYGANIDALLDRGQMALEDREWDKAIGFYDEVLNNNPRCAEAYLGQYLANKRKKDLPSVINDYISDTEHADTETLVAADPDKEHVDSIVNAYTIPNYYTEEAIRKEYDFDFKYHSSLSYRQNQKDTVLSEINNDKQFSRANQYASGATKELIDSSISQLTSIFDQRIAEAEKQDNESINAIVESYNQFKDQTDIKVGETYEKTYNRREKDYSSAVDLYNNAKTESAFKNAAQKLEGIGKYEDAVTLSKQAIERANQIHSEEEKRIADEKARAAKKKKIIIASVAIAVVAIVATIYVVINVIIPNNRYNDAIALKNQGKYLEAISAFEKMEGYKDSDAQIENCKQSIYDSAVQMMNEERYQDAINTFNTVSTYKDSSDMIIKCQNEYDYNAALESMNNGDYENAVELFTNLNGYRDSIANIDICQNWIKYEDDYNNAVSMMNSKEYWEAMALFSRLNGYADSEEKINDIKKTLHSIDYISSLSVGDMFYMGHYNTDIKWKIIDRKDDKILVITDNIITTLCYNDDNVGITWEKCTLRKWLNSDFYDAAFSDEEKGRILTTDVIAEDNAETGIEAGNNTKDMLFLLSISEAEKYFGYDEKRIATYNLSPCDWWLRSPGKSNNYAACVFSTGSINEYGNYVGESGGYVYASSGVRPAMWITIE